MLKSYFLLSLILFLPFSTQADPQAGPIVLNNKNWCNGSEILKVDLLQGILVGDKVETTQTLAVEPSSGAVPKITDLKEDFEVVEVSYDPVQKLTSTKTKIVVKGSELGDRIVYHPGFLNKFFRGLFEVSPIGAFNGTLLEDVTVPVKNADGTITPQKLKAACLFQSPSPYPAERDNPKSDDDRGYLRKYESLTIIVSPEVPYGVVSFTSKVWMSDTIDKPQTKNESSLSLRSVSRLIPVEVAYPVEAPQPTK